MSNEDDISNLIHVDFNKCPESDDFLDEDEFHGELFRQLLERHKERQKQNRIDSAIILIGISMLVLILLGSALIIM